MKAELLGAEIIAPPSPRFATPSKANLPAEDTLKTSYLYTILCRHIFPCGAPLGIPNPVRAIKNTCVSRANMVQHTRPDLIFGKSYFTTSRMGLQGRGVKELARHFHRHISKQAVSHDCSWHNFLIFLTIYTRSRRASREYFSIVSFLFLF